MGCNMDFYRQVAKAMAIYSNGYTAQAIAELAKAGVRFEEAVEMLCAFDDAR